jgi:uncharacterized membrane protein YphA (DoxX/SURF4 family)
LAAARWLRWGLAFVWLWTGAAVFHPHYRSLGEQYLAPLGLPPPVMYATCAAEVLLGLRVALGRAATWLTVLQVVTISGFTAILSVSQPELWLNPLGMLTKNLALVVMIGAAWLLERSARLEDGARWLRTGMGVFWIVQGILALVGRDDPSLSEPLGSVLAPLAVAGIVIGVVLSLRPVVATLFFLGIYGIVLVLVTVAVSRIQPMLWFHPFGPLTKNVALAVAAWVIARHCVLRRVSGDR